MKATFSVLILSLIYLTPTYSQDSEVSSVKEETKDSKQPLPQMQEERMDSTPYKLGPYKDGIYEYYGDEQREKSAKEKERLQQSQ